MQKVSLYSKDAKGALRVWSVEEDIDGILIKHGILGGQMQEQEEYVEQGLAGRSLQEQIDLKMKSRISKKMDKGYIRSLEEAKQMDIRKTALGFQKPMLAQRLDKMKESELDTENGFTQFKYDGNRCLTVNNGEIVTYSRNGKPQESLWEIRDELRGKLPYDCTIDGELYIHGLPLQTIRSYVARRQSKTAELVYVVYDIMEDAPYEERYRYLQEIIKNTDRITLAPTRFWRGENLHKLRDVAIGHGYEGLMLRHGLAGYENDRRSKSLIKIKKFFDREFVVVDVISSKDGWGILQCETEDGTKFGTPAPGDMLEKERVLSNKEKYIGKRVTVEFAGLTKEGKPFHPIAKCWHEEE